jgi:large subunit ribosomal protein L18
MSRLSKKLESSLLRKNRVRAGLKGSESRPRLSVFISNSHVSAQIIDDINHKTIIGVSTAGSKQTGSLTEKAEYVGSEIAKKAKAKKINNVVFDRGSRIYHGRVKALAEAARKEGLGF